MIKKSESPHKNQARHGWSGCDSTYVWHITMQIYQFVSSMREKILCGNSDYFWDSIVSCFALIHESN